MFFFLLLGLFEFEVVGIGWNGVRSCVTNTVLWRGCMLVCSMMSG